MTNRVSLSNPRPPLVQAFTDTALGRIIKRAGPIHYRPIKVGVSTKNKETASPIEHEVYATVRSNVGLFLREIIEKALQFSAYRKLKLKSKRPKITTESILEAIKLSRYNISLICGTEDFVGPKMIKMSGGSKKAEYKSDGKIMKMTDLDNDIRLLKNYTQSLLPLEPISRMIRIMSLKTLAKFKLGDEITMTTKALQTIRLLLEQFITALSQDAWAICKHKKHIKLQASDVELAIQIKKYYK